MSFEEELEKEIERKKLLRKKEEEERDKMIILQNMSFIERLQQPGFEENLKYLKLRQKETFKTKLKKEFSDELFELFFNDLLTKKTKSVNEWVENWKKQKQELRIV